MGGVKGFTEYQSIDEQPRTPIRCSESRGGLGERITAWLSGGQEDWNCLQRGKTERRI